MTKVDQAIRFKWIDASSAKSKDAVELAKQTQEIDKRDTQRMQWIVGEFGWPTPEMVGKQASGNAWLLVQHSPDIGFQRKCLALIEPLARQHVIDGKNYAYLYDRVQVNSGGIQRFGTQAKIEDGYAWIQPVLNPQHLDSDRKEFGMGPISEYLKLLADTYKCKVSPDWQKKLILPPKKGAQSKPPKS
jgi:hypothetical protein